MTLPLKIRHLFYRYHAEQLDAIRHLSIIVPTVLNDGTIEDWDWLFQVYTWETIVDWLKNPVNASMLSPPLEKFWTAVILNEIRDTSLWTGGNGRRKVRADELPDWFPSDFR